MKALLVSLIAILAISVCYGQNPDQRTSFEFKYHQEFSKQEFKDLKLVNKNNPSIFAVKMIIPKSDIFSVILAGGYGSQKTKTFIDKHLVDGAGSPWNSTFFEVGFKLYIGEKK
jgi:hypothetical protein